MIKYLVHDFPTQPIFVQTKLLWLKIELSQDWNSFTNNNNDAYTGFADKQNTFSDLVYGAGSRTNVYGDKQNYE